MLPFISLNRITSPLFAIETDTTHLIWWTTWDQKHSLLIKKNNTITLYQKRNALLTRQALST